MAGKWGLAGECRRLNDFGTTVFNNIAPVDPEASLSALEQRSSGIRE
jgi:hypothetical protein